MNTLSWLIVICLVLGFISNAPCLAQPVGETEKSNNDDNNDNDDVDDDDYYFDYDYTGNENDNKNPENNIAKPLTAVIEEPPYFEQTDILITSFPNTDVLLNCDVRNFHVNNVVIWYKDQAVYAHGQYSMNKQVEAFKNNSILLKNVQANDAGNYYCEVQPQNIRQHFVLELKKMLNIQCDGRDVLDRTIVFREGESHICECKTQGSSDGTIKWFLNGQRINETIGELEDGSMILNGINDHHSGIYQCLDDDAGEKPRHGMFNIVVLYKPKMTTHRHHINTEIGGTADLYCDYKGDPIAITHWLKNNRPISYSEKYMITNTKDKHFNRTTLTVRDVTKDDLGEYICQAENPIGSNELRTHLMLEPEKGQLEDVTIEGRKITLRWLVRSLQPLSEAVLDYKMSESFTWSSTTVIHTQRHENGMWKVTHEMQLIPGEWQTRMKTKNIIGWSKFSTPFIFQIEDDDDDDEEDNNDKTSSGNDMLAMAGFGSRSSSASSVQICYQSILLLSLLLVVNYN